MPDALQAREVWARTLPNTTTAEVRAAASAIGKRAPRADWRMLAGMLGIDGKPVTLTKKGPQ